ncbi:MAG TPA: hypothetical protein VG893_11355 [Terracidiphilus sp.]|nr:hypothetical protein [Terracidiphilus sp.]
MMTPPPVSGVAYPSIGVTEEQERANFLSGGLTFTAAYVDNVLAGQLAQPVSGKIYTVQPFISVQQTTPRRLASLEYTSGFTFYDPTSELNQIDQNASAIYQYRMTPRVSIELQDAFVQSSNAFSAATSIGGTSITGSGGLANVITPFGNRLTNQAAGGLTYQFALNAMVGGSAENDYLNYPDLSQVPGLSNSNAMTGSAFYSRRLAPAQYLGLTFLYHHITTSPVDSTTDTYLPALFYTFYIRRNISISLMGGGEYYNTAETGLPEVHAWTPAVTASGGYQGTHGALAASYTRSVSAGGGLLGSYTATEANGTASWKPTKVWTAEAVADYALDKNESSVLFPSGEGGHSIVGTASITRTFWSALDVQLGYSRIHAHYNGISAINNDPDSNRGFVSLVYRFTKPLGR